MTGFRVGRTRLLFAACAVVALLITVATASADRGASPKKPSPPTLDFASCGLTPQASRTVCATADLPMDYGHKNGRQVHIAVARVPATGARLGVLFFNFGGPGGTAVDYLQIRGASTLWHALNEHFDIIGFDPRGVGQSTPGIDCKANQETEGIYAQPFTTPFNVDRDALVAKVRHYIELCQKNNGDILEHVSTANVARDMDQIRALHGESKINYFGYSYGTFLGATYASLFPNNYRAMVLDGPIDATAYINKPWRDLAEQTQGFERALGRFFQACAGDQAACAGFGGSDPWDAYDRLVEQANATPIPAPNSADPRPVDGDDINFAAANELYAKEFWGELAEALTEAQAGDGSFIRDLVDGSYGRNDDGTFGNGLDLYFTIGASEQRYPRDVDFYLDRGDEAWGTFPHDYWNNGYPELNYGLWPSHDRDAFAGPFRVPGSSPTPLVVATTYDPATPYNGALRLVHDLGNARLITMRGDGHTAYGGESACIDAAVNAYLNTLALPAEGTSCTQDTPFLALNAFAKAKAASQVEDRHAIVGRVPGVTNTNAKKP
jgi:pimeloyl-ACP methyl ester carboxylesterase